MLVWVDNAQPSSTRTAIGHASHPRGGARAVLPPSIAVLDSRGTRGGQVASWPQGQHRTNHSSRPGRWAVVGFVRSGPNNEGLDSFDPSSVSEQKKESNSRQSCGDGLLPIAALMRG